MTEGTVRDLLWRRVRDSVAAHQPYDRREVLSRSRFLRSLERLESPLDQSRGRVHVTGSALITGRRGVVLHLHKRLRLWLQPGGHVESGETPWEAALREAVEETGLPLHFAPAQTPELLHLDVHKGGRGHIHLDLRYRILASDQDPAPPAGESPECRWFSPAEALSVADPGLVGALQKLGLRRG